MGNKCNEPHSESNMIDYSNSLVSFIKQFVQEYNKQHKGIEQLSKYVNSFKKDQFTQMLQNDHYITLLSKNSIKMEIQQLARLSMNDSFFIINELRIQNLQFQDLYNDIKLQKAMVYDTTKLRNKQFDYSKEIVAESVLYNIFLRMCDEKSVLYQLIYYWVVEIKNPDYAPIIDIVSHIAARLYESLRDVKIPGKIYELVIIWMVQVVVFNLAQPPTKKGSEEHLLDLIFYHRCPIEKLMIIHAQDQLIRKQFVIRDTDDLANRTDQILRDYGKANKLQQQIQLINKYVKEDWFITLSHTLNVWNVITKRF